MTKEMTLTGKVFKSYAEAVVNAHGFGSNKMVKWRDTPYMKSEAEWRRGDDFFTFWPQVTKAEQWLIENGYLREYEFCTERSGKYKEFFTAHTYFGLTAKGWAIANRYLNSK